MKPRHHPSSGRRTQEWSTRQRSEFANSFKEASGRFWLLVGFLGLAFALGGGSRSDIGSLIILRPVSAVVLGVGLIELRWEHVRAYRYLFALAAASSLLVLFQLLPLPPHIFYALPGRAVVADIDRASGAYGVWRPMTLAPSQTWNALWSMMAPLAVLVLVAQIAPEERKKLVGVFLLLGLASAVLAFFQILGDPHGPLYLYDDTSYGAPDGLFANRNHEALLLATLFPMLAVWGTASPGHAQAKRHGEPTLRAIAALVAGTCLLPLILVTGSRSGLLTSVLALMSVPVIARVYAQPSSRVLKTGGNESVARTSRYLPAAAVAAGALLVVLAVWLGRAAAIDRLLGASAADEMRIKILPTLQAMTREYWPWGSGFGSFKPVYRAHEMDSSIAPMIMNHAHNDWIEPLVVGGLPALVLVVAAVLVWLVGGARFLGSRTGTIRSPLTNAGFVIVLLVAVASISDYPLRSPSLICLAVCAATWAAGERKPTAFLVQSE